MLSLQQKLKKVEQVFATEKVLSRGTTSKDIARYYKANVLPYFLFHNKDGFVHMGLSKGDIYKKEDVLEQPKIVSKYIDLIKATNVLELATGKGASSLYLANKYPTTNFYGIDLPNGQLEIANKNRNKIPNFKVAEGDYHNLSLYSDNQFDIVFVIEALCHSDNKHDVAKEVNRILQQGGYFIVIDGYLAKAPDTLNETQLKAKRLTEKGMAVNNFEPYGDFKDKVMSQGYEIEYEENATHKIMPNLKRFEFLSSLVLFLFTPLGRLLANIFPDDFTYNAISGYLMPNLLEEGVACYYITVFRKK